MYKLLLQWKQFSVDLEAMEAKMHLDYPDIFAFNQAAKELELYFNSEPSEQQKSDIRSYWEGLTAQSAEALSYRSRDQIKNAISDAKATIVNKSWDQMNTVERKLMLGLEVSKQELIEANLL